MNLKDKMINKTEIKRLIKNNIIVLASLLVLIIGLSIFFYIKENPNSLNGQLRTASQFEQQGKLALAIDIYNNLVRKYPQNYTAHYKLGDLFVKVQEPEKAKIEYFRAINIGLTKRYEAQFALAKMYEDDGNFPFAGEILKNLANINHSTEVKEYLGNFYVQWGNSLFPTNPNDSLEKYKLAYRYLKESNSKNLKELLPILEKTYSTIADSMIADNRSSDAISLLESFLKLYDNAIAHYKLAQIYQQNSDEPQAIEEYKEAFKLNPDVGSKDGLSKLLIKEADELKANGDIDKSNKLYEEASKLMN